ncbi:MAG: methyltransferase [Actinomycetota bacterium]|nr:methyltransferase [Actinomycetota bacterium]
MVKKNIPETSPELIFRLRDSSFANDLFITAVGYFDFFNFIKNHPADIDKISRSLKIKKTPLDVMLTLFKAYGFIKDKDNKFYLSAVADDYLTGESSFDLRNYIGSLKDRPACEEMKGVLITGKPAAWAAVKRKENRATSMENLDFARSYAEGVKGRGAYLANGLLDAVNLKNYRKILDIGGSIGIYSAVLLRNYRNLKAAVYEKPPVDKIAELSIKKSGLKNRMDVITGNIFKESFPEGYDVHLFSHVIYDWDFDKVRYVLKKSCNSLEPGGMVIVHGVHINEDKTGPVSAAEYSVLVMFLTGGKCYSVCEMKQILEESGFKDIMYRPTVLNRSVITGVKR